MADQIFPDFGSGQSVGEIECFGPFCPDPGGEGALSNLVGTAAEFLLVTAAIITFIYLLIGGITWITAGGDKSATEAARSRITNALIGLVIVASAWAIFALADDILGLGITDNTDEPYTHPCYRKPGGC